MENLFSIGELAKYQNISKQTLIFYDKIGLFRPAYVDPDNGYRYYSAAQLDFLDTILIMKKIGFSLKEIQEHMKHYTIDSSLVLLRSQLTRIDREIAELNLIRSRIRGRRGAQAGIALLALLVDMCTANNTVAIVMAGPIAKEISDEYGVDPRRSASLLDMFTSVGQGMIPYGAQLLSAATLTGLTSFDIIPYLIYPVLMAVCGVAAIALSGRSK